MGKSRRKEHVKTPKSVARKTGGNACKKSTSILILGDGDFSFSAGLVKHVAGAGGNIVATSLDSRAGCVKKYGASAAKCIEACEKAGVSVKHGVDATALQKRFQPDTFHCCIFNFPHTGEQRVHSNQAMLRDFFKSARPLLKLGGEIHITLKMAPPYSEWDVPSIAQGAGYVKYHVHAFDCAQYPGYKHRTTLPDAQQLDTSSKEGKVVTLVFRRMRACMQQSPAQALDVSVGNGSHVQHSTGTERVGRAPASLVSRSSIVDGVLGVDPKTKLASKSMGASDDRELKKIDQDGLKGDGTLQKKKPSVMKGDACAHSIALERKAEHAASSCGGEANSRGKHGLKPNGRIEKTHAKQSSVALQKKKAKSKAKKQLHACAAAKAQR